MTLSLFYILGLFNIESMLFFQFLCPNKVRVLKKPMCLVVYILGLFIFLISSLFYILGLFIYIFFFVCFLSK